MKYFRLPTVALLVFAFSFAHASTPSTEGTSDIPASEKISCGTSTIVVIGQDINLGKRDFTVIKVDKSSAIPQTTSLTKLFKNLILESHDIENFRLVCVSNVPGVHIPNLDNRNLDLNIIVTDENRLIDGYNLTAHPILDETK